MHQVSPQVKPQQKNLSNYSTDQINVRAPVNGDHDSAFLDVTSVNLMLAGTRR